MWTSSRTSNKAKAEIFLDADVFQLDTSGFQVISFYLPWNWKSYVLNKCTPLMLCSNSLCRSGNPLASNAQACCVGSISGRMYSLHPMYTAIICIIVCSGIGNWAQDYVALDTRKVSLIFDVLLKMWSFIISLYDPICFSHHDKNDASTTFHLSFLLLDYFRNPFVSLCTWKTGWICKRHIFFFICFLVKIKSNI